MQTIQERVALKKARLSSEGQRVLQILQQEYGMTQEAAKRLINDGGQLFVVSLLTRRGAK